MYNQKILSYALVFLVIFNCFMPASLSYAATADGIVNSLTSSTTHGLDNGGGGILGELFGFLFDKLLAPILNIFNKSAPVGSYAARTSRTTTGSKYRNRRFNRQNCSDRSWSWRQQSRRCGQRCQRVRQQSGSKP